MYLVDSHFISFHIYIFYVRLFNDLQCFFLRLMYEMHYLKVGGVISTFILYYQVDEACPQTLFLYIYNINCEPCSTYIDMHGR